ncbi:hypothetical protein EYC59_04900 [Candidatus Saccharibacteria bacterium]|nr:MAG: hypothetical protein EYC59_04900 [Candidatus Saccharibacteria bacterium]
MTKTEEAPHEAAKEPAADTAQQQADVPTHEHSAPKPDAKPEPQRQKYNLSVSRNVLIASAIVLGVGLSFITGAQFQKHRGVDMVGDFRAGAMSTDGSYGPGMGMGGRYGARMGGVGTVTAVSSSSITITLRSFGPDSSSSGTSKTYTINDSTKVTVDGTTGTVSDIKKGDTVFIRTSSSSSTTATQIRVGDMPTPSANMQNDTSNTTESADTSTI